jgi:hypothetical protein
MDHNQRGAAVHSAALTGPDADSPLVLVADRVVLAQRNGSWGLFIAGILVRPLNSLESRLAERTLDLQIQAVEARDPVRLAATA